MTFREIFNVAAAVFKILIYICCFVYVYELQWAVTTLKSVLCFPDMVLGIESKLLCLGAGTFILGLGPFMWQTWQSKAAIHKATEQ